MSPSATSWLLNYLRVAWLHQFPGQPVSTHDNPFNEWIFPNIVSKLLWVNLRPFLTVWMMVQSAPSPSLLMTQLWESGWYARRSCCHPAGPRSPGEMAWQELPQGQQSVKSCTWTDITPGTSTCWAVTSWNAAWWKRTWGSCWTPSWNEPPMCLYSPAG